MFKRQGILCFLNFWEYLNTIFVHHFAAGCGCRVGPTTCYPEWVQRNIPWLMGLTGTSHRSQGPQRSEEGRCRPQYCGTSSFPGSSISRVLVFLWTGKIHPLIFSLTLLLCDLSLSFRKQRPINCPRRQEKSLLLEHRHEDKGSRKMRTICSLMSLENGTPLTLPLGEAAKATQLHSPSQFSHPRKDRKASTQITHHRPQTWNGKTRLQNQSSSPPEVIWQQQCQGEDPLTTQRFMRSSEYESFLFKEDNMSL